MRIDIRRFDKRKVARVVAVLAVALAAGHLVQTMAARQQTIPLATATPADTSRPVAVVQLAGTNDQIIEPAAPLPASAGAPAALVPAALPIVPLPAAVATPAAAPLAARVDPCPVTLDVMADPGAMLGLTLLAPCHPGERLVLHHAGLAVTARTTANGTLFAALPALQSPAIVEVRFADGAVVDATLEVPDLARLRRFGVQWQGDDAFQVYGFEGDTAISAADPGLVPSGGPDATGGFLTRLGDASTAIPLLAEIYTFPASGSSDVVIEAAVTPATCGREILGETLGLVAGRVTITDLTLAMPDCDAIGDFLVLNNLAPDLTLAAAN